MNRTGTKRRSNIWSYFAELGSDVCKCNFCSQKISYKGGSTFNLTRHVRTKHPHATEANREGQTTLTIPIAPSTSATSSNDYPTETRADQPHSSHFSTGLQNYFYKNTLLTRALIQNYLPFRLVEDEDFKHFVKGLHPAYQMPSRKTVSKVLIPQYYNLTREAVQNTLQDVSAVCLSTDGWTSSANQSYLSVTAHFIQENKMQSFLLVCYHYTESHSADNLASELKKVAENWRISDKIVAIVSDNAPNIVAAIRNTSWKHIPCFAHNLNLIVQTGLRQIIEIQKKVKKIVEYFKSSSQASEKLKAMQKQMGKPILCMKQDVITRWNSTFDMFSRIIEIKESLMSTLAIHYPHIENLNHDDVTLLEKCCDILQIFKDVTEEISSEKQVTASKVILLSSGMKTWCLKYLKENPDLPEKARKMCESLCESINKRFAIVETNSIFAESTFLDPRFKNKGFSNLQSFEAVKQHVTKYATNIQILIQEQQPESTQKPPTSRFWSDFDESVANLITNPNPRAAGVIEVEKYIQEPLLLRSANPLLWWEERRNVYPRLFDLMKKRLCIVGTSVPCERVVSKAGQTVTEKRSRLSGEKVAQIVFLNVNM